MADGPADGHDRSATAIFGDKNLGKSYGHAEILKEINLTVEQGEVLALIGPTGSGKTTLLRLVNLLERPSFGQHPLQRPGGLTAVRRRRAAWPAAAWPWSFKSRSCSRLSVQENVSFGLKMRGRDDREKVREALEAVGLSGYEKPGCQHALGRRDAENRPGQGPGPGAGAAASGRADSQPGSEERGCDRPAPAGAGRTEDDVIMATHNMREALKLASRWQCCRRAG